MAALIGIRREDKYPWERRVPLTPSQILELMQFHSLRFRVQPSPNRVFTEEEYRAAGAEIDDDLSPCEVILGIKEIPPGNVLPGKTYLFFSHTTKGQPANMPLLHRLLELSCQLIDFEKITDASGRRLVFFGRFAGIAGMLETLSALGKRLAWEGIRSPFEELKRPYEYAGLEEARVAVQRIGEYLKEYGVPQPLAPLIVGFAGYGNVSGGAQEIFDLLPHRVVHAGQLAHLFESLRPNTDCLYKVVFTEADTVEPIIPSTPFSREDYFGHPERYRSRFEAHLPYLTVLVNAIYWSAGQPRLVTKSFLRQMYRENKPRLRIIGDISCDIEGAIEPTVRFSTPTEPVYVYDPFLETSVDGVAGKGPVILAIDNLPSELPRESSVAFGKALQPFIPPLAETDYALELDQQGLSEELYSAVICNHGRLAPKYSFLEKHLAQNCGMPISKPT